MKKRVLSLLLTMVMMVGLLPNAFAAKKPTFTDVSKDMWCYDYVEFVAKKGYFKGTTETTFAPNNTMTRQQFVTVLGRMVGAKVDHSVTVFSDVPVNTYSTGYIAWAVKHGIVNGYEDGTFRPTQPVTRQQMAAFMSRFMDYYTKVYGAKFLKKATASSFNDYERIANPEFKACVDRCRVYGLIEGYADGFYRPANNATRAHVAAVITRLAKVMRLGGGGGGGDDYELNYISDDSVVYSDGNDDGVFTIVDITDTTAVIDPDLYFLNWSDEAGANSYVAGDKLVMAEEGEEDIYANWADKNDLLYLAIGKTVNEINSVGNDKLGEFDAAIPYVAFADMKAVAPMAVVNGARNVNLAAAAELDADIVEKLIATAATYAIEVLGNGAKAGAELALADVEELVKAVLDVIDPTQVWWTGASRTAKIKNLAKALYEEVKFHGVCLLDELYSVNGKAIFDAIALKDGNSTLVVVKNDKKFYNADGSALGAKAALVRVAKAVAVDLAASLKGYTDYTTELVLTGDLTAEFDMAPAFEAQTAGFPTVYNFNAIVELDSDGVLAYKYDAGRNYVQLIVDADMQAAYEENADAIVKAALENKAAVATLKNKLMSGIESKIPAELKSYVDEKALNDAVDAWLVANLDTTVYEDATAPYYLPYEYFWFMGGKVDENGKVLTGDTTRHLFNNEDLIAFVDGVVLEVAKDKAAEAGFSWDVVVELDLEKGFIEAAKRGFGIDIDAIAAGMAGEFSKYLNNVGVVNSFAGLMGVKVGSLTKVMTDDIVLNKLNGKAPSYVKAIAKVIEKVDSNTSALTINGVTVDASDLAAVKAAKDGKALCLAVADLLNNWSGVALGDAVTVDMTANVFGATANTGVVFQIVLK